MSIAVDAERVYWADYGVGGNDGAVMTVPIGGGTVTTLATGQTGPNCLVVDDDSVYWTDYGDGLLTEGSIVSDGAVMKVAKPPVAVD
jgi:hypothetical protein